MPWFWLCSHNSDMLTLICDILVSLGEVMVGLASLRAGRCVLDTVSAGRK